jgi:putative MATE family efflux protein
MEDVRQNTDARFSRMTTAPTGRLVCKMAAPAIVIMLTSSLYNTADTYFVGRLGTGETAAVGIALPLMAAIQALGFFFGHGTGNYISRALGARNAAGAERMAAVGFFSALLAGACLAAVGTRFLMPLARLLGAPYTSFADAREYLFFILLGAPFMVGSIMLNNLFRFQGNAFLGMFGMTSGAVLNMALDPLFIFGFGWGVRGAALATALSQAAGCALLLTIARRSKRAVRVSPRAFRPSLRSYAEIVRGGLPTLLRQGLMSISVTLLNRAAGSYGDAVIAAISVAGRVFVIATSTMLGIGQGFQPVCGFNYGAKQYGRVKQAFWFCTRIGVAGMALCGALCFAFAPHIIALFRRDDPEVIRIGGAALRLQCLAFPFAGWVILCNMLLENIGNVVKASVLSLARQGVFLIPLLLTLVPRLGVRGIQLSIPVSDFCAFLVSLPLAAAALRRDLSPPPGGSPPPTQE